MVAADVIEHTVEHDAQAPRASRGDEGVEIRIIAKPWIDLEMIDRVIAMRG